MAGRDALLPVGFTQPPPSLTMLVRSYRTLSPLPLHFAAPKRSGVRGGLLSVALARGSPRVAVSNHRALWSPDFPRPAPSPRKRPVRRNAFTRSAHSRLLVYRSAPRCPTSLNRCRVLPPSKNSTSLNEASSRNRWLGVCGPESSAWRTKDLIGLTWETTSTVLPS